MRGDILEMTPEAYRKRLSRVRRQMADFLGQYCGEYGSGRCKCKERVNYAIQNRRIFRSASPISPRNARNV